MRDDFGHSVSKLLRAYISMFSDVFMMHSAAFMILRDAFMILL